MARFIVRRLLAMVGVLFAISVLTFLIFQAIPNGDPAVRLGGRTSTPETRAAIRKDWGFDKPIYEQYFITMGKVFDGSIVSYQQQINVEDEIKRDLPATLSLAIGAGIIWLGFGILFGVISAVKAGKFTDTSLTVLALIGVSMPVFLLGALVLWLLAYKVQIFPAGGYVTLTQDPWGWFTHLLLPWFVLSVLFIGFYSRVLRSNILDTINEDYVRTARAKGLSERRILIHHVLRNSLIPVVSLFGLDFAAVIGGGAILTETVFNLQGVGQYAANSIQQLDVPPGARDHDVRRLLRRGPERHRRHHLCGARPADQAERLGSADGGTTARDRGPEGRLRDRRGDRARRRRRLVLAGVRRGAEHRRRVRLRQVGHRDDDPRPDAGTERADLGVGPLPGQGAHDRQQRRARDDPRRPDRDGLPGPDVLVQPGPQDRRPDHRGDPGAQGDRTRPRRRRRPSRRCGPSASPTPNAARITIRSSSPAACASGR